MINGQDLETVLKALQMPPHPDIFTIKKDTRNLSMAGVAVFIGLDMSFNFPECPDLYYGF